MTGATHILAGATVYKYAARDSTISKIVAIGMAFCSHFLLDHIPHFELSMPWQLTLAVLVAVFILLVSRHDLMILSGGFAGLLPDIIVKLNIWPAFNRIHNYFHFHLPYSVPMSLIYLEFGFDLILIALLIRRTGYQDMKRKI
jgi:hypothetical protein